MTKTIDTLVDDIQKLITERGYDSDSALLFGEDVAEVFKRRFAEAPEIVPGSKGTLRMSNLGTPCKRKLWYHCNTVSGEDEGISPDLHLKFAYGDLIESLILALARGSGHSVEREQQEIEINGIKGHLDCVIDGMVIDVKSASDFAYNKFKFHALEGDDTYGYLEQLSSYLYALQDDPVVTEKSKAGFLAFNKSTGEMVLDVYDMTRWLRQKERTVEKAKDMVSKSTPPVRGYREKKFGEAGNYILSKPCEWCQHKFQCWGKLRMFEYAGRNGPEIRYFTKVVKEPKVKEIT